MRAHLFLDVCMEDVQFIISRKSTGYSICNGVDIGLGYLARIVFEELLACALHSVNVLRKIEAKFSIHERRKGISLGITSVNFIACNDEYAIGGVLTDPIIPDAQTCGGS